MHIDVDKIVLLYNLNLTLIIDLENEGQTHLCMAFRNSGCKNYTDMICVSILTISRPR